MPIQTIPLDKVTLPKDRQRTFTDPKKLEELKKSILAEGLFHAIILSEDNTLVAGATRLQAVLELAAAKYSIFYNREEVPLGTIPYTYTHKTDESSLFRIELEENLRREQLSPIDEAQALARLHEMMQNASPELVPGMGIRAPVTFQETAAELGKITGKPKTNDAQRISDSILVDKFKEHPEVKRAKTLGEAAKQARKVAEREFRSLLGTMDQEASTSRHRLHVGDCEEVMAKLPDGIVDALIVDPPYGVGADSFGDQSRIGHEYEDTQEAWADIIASIEAHASRITKPDAAMFLFCDIEAFFPLREVWADLMSDWYVWPTPLIWNKPNRGHAPQPKRGPSRRYEAILYAIKGNREVRKVGADVLTFNVPDNRSHAAGKPPALYAELLSWVAYPGDVVLDPCAGSGTVVEAAELLDCSAIAIERDPAYATLIQEKIEKGNDK